jgi:hypothetical protein
MTGGRTQEASERRLRESSVQSETGVMVSPSWNARGEMCLSNIMPFMSSTEHRFIAFPLVETGKLYCR